MPLASLLAIHERESLYSGANAAIWHSHRLAGELAKKRAREEDYVATLVTDGVGILAHRWAPMLRSKGIYLKLSGVFCHGHPQVSFGTPPSRVELADLLVVHQHTKASRKSARAILLQAKMSTNGTHSLSSSDAQLQLFRGWPPFEFVSGGLAPGMRLLKEKGRGSRYALVHDGVAYPEDIPWADQCPWAVSRADQKLTADRSLARLLGDILLNRDGRPFQLGVPNDDWSRTIHELLKTTGQRTYKRANIGRGEVPRITEAFSSAPGLMLTFSQDYPFAQRSVSSRTSVLERYFGGVAKVQRGGEIPTYPSGEQSDGPDGGISSLIIETAEGFE
ncbi:hypothetical protein WKW80_05755 [Variovorax humicola]|uniref:Uncharacterized protein n=1 Tax=Variovorax humicola TaxID=1769758 RepID=A0ABU8VX16_9BURK